MRENYQVVVIGAGIIGLSAAYYLMRKGCSRLLVLEKEESWVTGSSARANGGFRQQFSTSVNIRMSQLSVPVFEAFDQEFQTDIGLRQNGYLFVTSTDTGRRGLLSNLELQKAHGVPVRWLETDELERSFPFLASSDLKGGAYCVKDGFADSYSIATSFGESARKLGAEVQFGLAASGLVRSGERICGVETGAGPVGASWVVNAAGPHAGEVGRMAGLKIPVQPVRRMLVMTEEFPELPDSMPMTVDIDSGVFARKESGRVLMGWSDPEEPPGFNLRFDPAIIDIVAEKAVRRIPVLENVHVNPRQSWAGLYAVTPDHHCILGEDPKARGLFLANGFSGHGMMHAPAAGMATADLILDGKTDLFDVRRLRPTRFAEGDLIEEKVVL